MEIGFSYIWKVDKSKESTETNNNKKLAIKTNSPLINSA
jgi:hypothetical protein